MATIKEQIARHTRSEATTQQQPVADDPLAPTPIRFTHWHDADGVIHQRTVNGPPPAGTCKTVPRVRMQNHHPEARPPRPPARPETTSSRRG